MACAAGMLEFGDFVIERLPASTEDMCARDDDVDLVSARFNRAANFRDALCEGR